MTRDDRLIEQGRMVEERREARGRLACLNNKARRYEVALERACWALRNSAIENWRIGHDPGALTLDAAHHDTRDRMRGEPLACPTPAEIAALLGERAQLLERLGELDRLLS